jgi:hypothetical protein
MSEEELSFVAAHCCHARIEDCPSQYASALVGTVMKVEAFKPAASATKAVDPESGHSTAHEVFSKETGSKTVPVSNNATEAAVSAGSGALVSPALVDKEADSLGQLTPAAGRATATASGTEATIRPAVEDETEAVSDKQDKSVGEGSAAGANRSGAPFTADGASSANKLRNGMASAGKPADVQATSGDKGKTAGGLQPAPGQHAPAFEQIKSDPANAETAVVEHLTPRISVKVAGSGPGRSMVLQLY